MDTIKQIQNFTLNNNFPDTLFVKEKDNLVLLNYKPEVQFDNLWTPIEIVCRGLMINKKTGEIIARPFDKFFNWGENNRITTSKIKLITEKLDGSLGILYRNNGYKIATRGAFDSDQALWATKFLYKKHGDSLGYIPNSWTVLFEIIYPENRIVIDYKDRKALVLLAIRNRFTGEYLPYDKIKSFGEQHNFSMPKIFQFNDINDILNICSKIDGNQEGYVIEFDNGERFKFKGDEYKRIHKLICCLSFNFILENHQAGNIPQILSLIPDEFKNEVNEVIEYIDNVLSETQKQVEIFFKLAPKETRKEYALWCKKEVPDYLPYMFARLDGRDILPIIYKFAFKKNDNKAFNLT